MFSEATAFNADISTWDISSVTDIGSMFSGATAFTGHLCVGHQLCGGGRDVSSDSVQARTHHWDTSS